MAGLTFGDLQSEVAAHLGIDIGDATNFANVKRWINYVQQNVAARWPWNFMFGRESITTIPDYQTGTVSVSTAGTTVTGVSTTFTSLMADGSYFIQFNSSNDWYAVTAQSSATSITISPAYAESPSLSGSGFIIRKFYYSLSANCDRIIDIRNWNTPCKLFETDPRTLDMLDPLVQGTDNSYAFIALGYDSAGNVRIQPYPWPSDARLYEIRTYVRLVDMVNASDISVIPAKWRYFLAWGANAIGFMYLRKPDMAQFWDAKFEQGIAMMKTQEKTSEDDFPILQSIDSVTRSNFINMPDQYPQITG